VKIDLICIPNVPYPCLISARVGLSITHAVSPSAYADTAVNWFEKTVSFFLI